jgi:hypothetical protein
MVDCVIEVSISASDDDVEISMAVTSVVSLRAVGISADVEDLIELDIVSVTVDETVD